jgi:hypothetical protein
MKPTRTYEDSIAAAMGISRERSLEIHTATRAVFIRSLEGKITPSEALFDLDRIFDTLKCTPIERLHEAYHYGVRIERAMSIAAATFAVVCP